MYNCCFAFGWGSNTRLNAMGFGVGTNCLCCFICDVFWLTVLVGACQLKYCEGGQSDPTSCIYRQALNSTLTRTVDKGQEHVEATIVQFRRLQSTNRDSKVLLTKSSRQCLINSCTV